MGQVSKIEWTDATWNPTRGCSRISPGCVNCYAEAIEGRFAIRRDPADALLAIEVGPFAGFVRRTHGKPAWTGKVELIDAKLTEPMHWKQPKRVFVNSMSDLFHEALPDHAIAEVFRTMQRVDWHTYQVLTKRSLRLREIMPRLVATFGCLKQVWIGVSVEDRLRKLRIEDLRQVDAALRFLSIEPLLEDLGDLDLTGIDWVIVGGESGSNARPCRLEWIRSVMAQCRAQGVPCFFKQAGAAPCIDYYAADDLREWALSGRHTVYNKGAEWSERDGQPSPGASIRVHLRDRKGGDLAELPQEFHPRQFPEAL